MGLAWLCRTAVVLEDVESAAILLELGRPHASRSVFTAAGTITLGVLGMWLAEVAILLGRQDEAAELLDGAEAHYRRLQDRGHLVECEYLRGRLAAVDGRPDAVALLGAAAVEADALGMARVARLARGDRARGPARSRRRTATSRRRSASSGVRARCGSCASAASTPACATRRGWRTSPSCSRDPASRSTSPSSWAPRPPLGASGSTQPVLDETAIAAYRARLRDLAAEEDDADAAGDAARATRARAEREAIADQLAADLGLGGAARTAPDWVERARKAVRRRVDAALKRIEAEHPAAGRHLRRSVRTGAFCAYDPAEPVHWET